MLRTFLGHILQVTTVAFSPDGSKVLTGSTDCTAMLWDISDLSTHIVRNGSSNKNSRWSVYSQNKNFVFYNSLSGRINSPNLIICNAQGKTVANIKSKTSGNGYVFTLPEYIAKGVYYYRFENRGTVLTRGKFSVVK